MPELIDFDADLFDETVLDTLSRRRGRQWCRCRRRCNCNRGEKAITLARRCRDVPPAAASIAQRPPQGADLEFEIPLLDKGALPHPGDQLVFPDQLPRALHQSGQNIGRTPAGLPSREH
jgi:hypothetical protein